jgi:hypothetical protein
MLKEFYFHPELNLSLTATIFKKLAVFQRHYEDVLYANNRKFVQELRKVAKKFIYSLK